MLIKTGGICRSAQGGDSWTLLSLVGDYKVDRQDRFRTLANVHHALPSRNVKQVPTSMSLGTRNIHPRCDDKQGKVRNLLQ